MKKSVLLLIASAIFVIISCVSTSAVTEEMIKDGSGNITLNLNADTEYTCSQLCTHLKNVGVSVSALTSYSLDGGETTFRSSSQSPLSFTSGESYSLYAPYNVGTSKQWQEAARFTVNLYTVPVLEYPDGSRKSLDEAVIGSKTLVSVKDIPYAGSKSVIFEADSGSATYEATYNAESKAYEAEITVPSDGLIKITVHRLTVTFPDNITVKNGHGTVLVSGADAEEGDYTVTVSPVGENAYVDAVYVNGETVTDGRYEKGNYIFSLSALKNNDSDKDYKIICRYSYRELFIKSNPTVSFIPCNYDEPLLAREIISAAVDKEKCIPGGVSDEGTLSVSVSNYKAGESYVTIQWTGDEKYPTVTVKDVRIILPSPEHISSDWITVKAPTCSTDGTKKKICTVCGETVGSQKISATKKHTYTSAVTKPGCTSSGYTSHRCTVCGYSYTDSYKGPLGHSYASDYTVDKKSTYTQKGSKSKHCTRKGCTARSSVTALDMLALAKVTQVKAKATETTAKISWKKVKGAEKYTVELLNSKGKSLKTITTKSTSYTFKGLSKGTVYKVRVRAKAGKNKGKYSSCLILSTSPAKAKISSLKSSGKSTATVKWKTVSGASGYQIQYSTSKKLKSAKSVSVKKGKTVKATLKKLKSKKKYYVRVRAYKTVNGKKLYGAWSTVKSVKVK